MGSEYTKGCALCAGGTAGSAACHQIEYEWKSIPSCAGGNGKPVCIWYGQIAFISGSGS